MRKLISAIALTGILALMVLPAVVSAQQEMPETCDTSIVQSKGLAECPAAIGDECSTNENDADYDANCGFCCMLNTVYKITTWLFYILMLVVTIMIIYGGFIYVTAAGDPEKAGKGKSVLTFAIIGLAIALLARVIPSLVRFVIGV